MLAHAAIERAFEQRLTTMKALFRKILCPVDFDRVALPALELARKLALQNDASVYLLYVIPGAKSSPDLEQVARDNLRGIARKWLEGKARYQIVLNSGEPAAGVVKTAQALGADVVVMATHGRTGADRARLGSVAERVVRLSTCPVVTVRPR